MSLSISIERYLQQSHSIPLADVRTPAEFEQGHIPGAFNLPLFTNEERVLVGTTYKKVGREAAILLGFDLTGIKWSGFIRQALAVSPQKKIAVHCWRGGMRSAAMAWALGFYGFEVYVVEGGYKRYRNWVLQQFEQPFRLRVLGGMTGTGKTKILHELKIQGEQIIDLEELAQHRGSSYGSMNRLQQPSQEQFENNLADQLSQLDSDRNVWVEDESITIGKRVIPRAFWLQIREASMLDLQLPLEKRIDSLVEEYGRLDPLFLQECTERIRKRLGLEQTKNALIALAENRIRDFIQLVLVYYDKTYRKCIASRRPGQVCSLVLDDSDAHQNALTILKHLAAPKAAAQS